MTIKWRDNVLCDSWAYCPNCKKPIIIHLVTTKQDVTISNNASVPEFAGSNPVTRKRAIAYKTKCRKEKARRNKK